MVNSPIHRLHVVCLSGLLLLNGCASASFTPYVGKQHWQIGDGAFIKTVSKFPIYIGWPTQLYTVLGAVKVAGNSRANFDALAVYQAKQQHADALIVVTSDTQQVGTVTTGNAYYGQNYGFGTAVTRNRYATRTIYLAIRFAQKNNPEIHTNSP